MPTGIPKTPKGAKTIAEPPPGFVDDFVSMSRADLYEKYGIGDHQMKVWGNAMPAKAKALRAELVKRGKLGGWHKPNKFTQDDRPKPMFIADPVAAEARVQDLIKLQQHANATAKRDDPYAGLTGFERQLAIAKAKGITATVRLPSRSISGADMGVGMSSAAWAVAGGETA